MSDKILKYIAVILCFITGIFLGIVMTSRKAADPALKKMLQQQSESLLALKQIQNNFLLGEGEGAGDKTAMQPLAAILLTQQDLQKRVTQLEAKLDAIMGIFKNPQFAGGRGARNPQAPPPEDMNKIYKIPLGDSYVRGDKNGKVTIVAFDDMQCPFCARFHPVTNEVLKAYPKGVRYIIKNFPLSFHPQAKPAAKVALAAGEQGKYFEMVDLILANNKQLSDEKYRGFAKKLGLNMKKFEKDLKDNDAKWEKQIEADIALGRQADVRGTPTFYLNGKKTVARSLDQFKKEIDSILKGDK